MFSYRHAMMGGVAVCAVMTALPAAAQVQTFDIPAQPARTAIPEFGRQSGIQILAAKDDVGDQQVPALKGDYEPREALRQMLLATNLRIASDDGRTVTLVQAPQGGSASDGADGTVEALIVTAQKREEDIQDVPIAISAFSQEDLTRSQIAGGPDLMTQVPNFTFTKTNFSGYSIQIRGIGTQAISATTDPAVAVAFNNTPFIRNRFFEQEFYDLERVEVLRGPQGTLYGRNATAGVVNIISAKPKHEFAAKLSADVANYQSTRLEGMLNLPLVEDKAALRIAGAWTKRDGYVKNLLTGDQTDGRDLWSARVTLGLTPTEKFSANLVYEHFEEKDGRLRSGKQLCNRDPGPSEVNGVPISPSGSIYSDAGALFFSQGCRAGSLYSPDSFDTPNGYALPYFGPLAGIGAPVDWEMDPYVNSTQSRDLREIETHITPEYEATADTVELQMQIDLTPNLTLTSETGFNRDYIFSFEDYNRFDTMPGIFKVGRNANRFDIIDENGVFCDPQLGCTSRLAAGDLSTAQSQQFSQEFRLSSNFDGPINFNLGANFLRYDTEEKYYVFINSLTAFTSGESGQFDPNDVWPGDNSYCFEHVNTRNFDLIGYVWTGTDRLQGTGGCQYIDPNDIHNLNDQGRNYFLSKNPYHLLSYAAFGEIYWQATPSLKITAGFRWTDDRKTAPQVPSWLLAANTYGNGVRKVINQEWREPTGRLAVDWKPSLSFTDETLLYAPYVRGYKAGGANPPPPIAIGTNVNNNYEAVMAESLTHPETFEPEFVNAYEIGTKNTLLDGSLTFNLNAFYYDYTGYQISQIVDRSAVNLNFDAEVWGSELEVDWRVRENLRLGFKGGYENTRVADESSAVDLIDRAAGDPNFIVKRPFPTIPSNCIVPMEQAFLRGCISYYEFTFDDVPNNGEGVAKDLSGNELPNAPKYTATITADYTLPLPRDWLATLHTDLYYQSEAWTRIFNMEGYDKLKAYSNINLAAIFTNEDAGWTVMAYIKNVLDKDNITGAFLNSDDTGLTTNVFLNEPRLFGLRVTKAWNGSDWWSAHANRNGYYPFRVELEGEYGRFTSGREVLAPATTALFPAEHPYPLGVQNDLDWGSGGGVKFSYQPQPNSWRASAALRYGKAEGSAEGHPKWDAAGAPWFGQRSFEIFAELIGQTPEYWEEIIGGKYLKPGDQGWYNYGTTTGVSEESHAFADFSVGKDFSLGEWARNAKSGVEVGLRYAQFRSDSQAVLHGRPDFTLQDDFFAYGIDLHRVHARMDAAREFKGFGPTLDWNTSVPLRGEATQSGAIHVEFGVGGAILLGQQKTRMEGEVTEEVFTHINAFDATEEVETTVTSLNQSRSTDATVPSINANLGLSYTLGGLKLSGGYRVERYFDAIDGGIAERKTYDRQFDGPYFKVSVGFGG